MKIVFISNFLNFHQVALWDSFIKNEIEQFVFLETSIIDKERISMGYNQIERSYVKNSTTLSDDDLKNLFKNTDIVFVGSVDDKRVYRQIKSCKNIVYITEHIKKKTGIKSYLSLQKYFLKLHLTTLFKNKWCLSSSAFAGEEFKNHFFKKNHIFKFGYFPEIKCTKDDTYYNKSKQVLWVGRFLDWKQTTDVLFLFFHILTLDPEFRLKTIGEGPEQNNIIKEITKNGLLNRCEIIGFQSNKFIIEEMNKSLFFALTSSRGEGWGVVLNEAMSQGCLCLANKNAGATNFLIKNGINGFSYSNYEEMVDVVDHYSSLESGKLNTISNNAIKTIKDLWNYQVASARLYEFCLFVLNKNNNFGYKEGPLSPFFVKRQK